MTPAQQTLIDTDGFPGYPDAPRFRPYAATDEAVPARPSLATRLRCLASGGDAALFLALSGKAALYNCTHDGLTRQEWAEWMHQPEYREPRPVATERDENPDPLAPARGIKNGILLSAGAFLLTLAGPDLWSGLVWLVGRL